MNYSSSYIYKVCVRLSIVAVFVGVLFVRCANVGYPTGGPRDSLPPVVVAMTPEWGAKNFTAKRIYIEFNEYVKMKDQQKEFYVSPFMEKKPVVTMRGKGIQIDLKDTLAKDQTYSLNFGESITDNNEGNPLYGFRYVFSTGSEIDSMVMSGYTVDAFTKDSVGKTYILYYPAALDSVPERDSTVFKCAPAAVGRSASNGIFIAQNLKPIDYRVYALLDKNGNNKYEPGVDRIGFLDSTYNPSTMAGFGARYDTVRKYLVADPQLYFRMFADKQFKRQNLTSFKRPAQHLAVMSFGADFPEIQSLTLDGIDSSKIVTEYLKPTRDSIALWFNVPSADLPDTIKGEITYLKHDSLSRLEPVTQKVALGWKAFEKKKTKEEKDLPPENPFKYKVDATNVLNPLKHIPILFDIPITKIDSTAISLIRLGEEEKKFRVKFQVEQDTSDMHLWRITAPWQADQKYSFLIPSGAIENLAGQTNDSLRAEFTVMSPEKYATLVLNVKGRTPNSKYIIDLLGQDNKVLYQKLDVTSGKHTFQYIDPGAIRIRVVEDVNGNRKWDVGDMISRVQPERVEFFVTEKGEMEITTKVNWTLGFDVDMEAMFAPISMEAVVEELRRADALMLQKREEARAKSKGDKKPAQNQNQNSGQGRNPMGGVGQQSFGGR